MVIISFVKKKFSYYARKNVIIAEVLYSDITHGNNFSIIVYEIIIIIIVNLLSISQ